MIARRTLARNGRETDRRCSTAIQLDGPHPIFGEDQTKESVQQLAEANFLPATRMEIVFTPIVVNTGPGLVLFDSGNSAERRPGAGNLVAGCAPRASIRPRSTWSSSPTCIRIWSKDERLSGSTEGAATLVQANVVPLSDRITFLGDEGEVVPGIHGLNAFGHTPGHMA